MHYSAVCLCVCVTVCFLSVFDTFYLFVSVCVYMSVCSCLSPCLFVYLLCCLPVCLYFCLQRCLVVSIFFRSICLSRCVRLFLVSYLSLYVYCLPLSVSQSFCLSICLPFCLSVISQQCFTYYAFTKSHISHLQICSLVPHNQYRFTHYIFLQRTRKRGIHDNTGVRPSDCIPSPKFDGDLRKRQILENQLILQPIS